VDNGVTGPLALMVLLPEGVLYLENLPGKWENIPVVKDDGRYTHERCHAHFERD
jgi:hypothetical protein